MKEIAIGFVTSLGVFFLMLNFGMKADEAVGGLVAIVLFASGLKIWLDVQLDKESILKHKKGDWNEKRMECGVISSKRLSVNCVTGTVPPIFRSKACSSSGNHKQYNHRLPRVYRG
jgi:hypothetical protein